MKHDNSPKQRPKQPHLPANNPPNVLPKQFAWMLTLQGGMPVVSRVEVVSQDESDTDRVNIFEKSSGVVSVFKSDLTTSEVEATAWLDEMLATYRALQVAAFRRYDP